MHELISVIINVYNGEKFIRKCLESILNQTYNNLEILIINDGSTDNTLNICNEYSDKRIRIINQKNMGLSYSRNVGIENAKGEFLYFVDSDDFIEDDTIEYLYNMYQKYSAPICTCKPYDIYDYNIQLKKTEESIKILDSKEMLKMVLLSTDRAVTIWNKLIKKELFEDIRFEIRPINDITVTYKLVIKAEKIAYSNQIKYYYLRHKNAITANEQVNTNRSIDCFNASMERYNNIKKDYPKLVENDISMLRTITMLYLRDNKELEFFLNNNNTLKLFRKLFTLKLLFCKISFNEKIKIVLLAINPNLAKFVNNRYQMISNKYKM